MSSWNCLPWNNFAEEFPIDFNHQCPIFLFTARAGLTVNAFFCRSNWFNCCPLRPLSSNQHMHHRHNLAWMPRLLCALPAMTPQSLRNHNRMKHSIDVLVALIAFPLRCGFKSLPAFLPTSFLSSSHFEDSARWKMPSILPFVICTLRTRWRQL